LQDRHFDHFRRIMNPGERSNRSGKDDTSAT
jgi:hypothetical protein